jgi:hypothetical protein
MAKGSNPYNVMVRMLIDARRLDQWAQDNGSPKQREFASNLLKVCEHATDTQVFTTNQSPAVSRAGYVRVTLEQMSPISRENAKLEGGAAYSTGLPLGTCPYAKTNPLREAWTRAWMDAEKEAINPESN